MKTFVLSALLTTTISLQLIGQNTLNFAFSIGGSGIETNARSQTDASGNNWIYGGFSSSNVDLDPGPGNTLVSTLGGEDGLIVRYDPNGNYSWSLQIGGGGYQRVNDICFEPNAINVCGFFQDTVDFDPGPGVTNLIGPTTAYSGFVARYTPTGTLIWAQAISNWSQANAIAVLYSGNIGVVGHFGGTIDADPGAGTSLLTTNGGHDCFYIELTPFTGTFVRSMSWGSAGIDRAYDVSKMGNNIVICGTFSDTCDFDPGAANSLTPAAGIQDGFIFSLDANLQFNWVISSGIALDEFVSMSEHPWASTMAAVSKSTLYNFDVNGNTLWAIPVGYNGYLTSVTHHPGGNVVVGGVAGSDVDFDPGPTFAWIYGGVKSYWATYDYSTGNYQFVKAIEGGFGVAGIGFTPDNRTQITGIYSDSAEYDLSSNDYYLYSAAPGSQDIFVAQYSNCTLSTDMQDIILCSGDTFICNGLHYVGIEFSPGSPQITCLEMNQAYSATETFSWVDTPVNGCDTLRTYTLHAIPALAYAQTVIICEGDSIVVGNVAHSTTGIFVDVLPSSSGCDSVVTTNLTVNTVDTSLVVTTTTLTSNAVGSTYQWIDCISGLAVPGATLSSFTPTVNGTYACSVTTGACTQSSGCYAFNDVGVREITPTSFAVYPNPVQGQLNISGEENILSIEIMDSAGRKVMHTVVNATSVQVNVNALCSGTYLLSIQTENTISVSKFTIQ